MFTCQKYIFRTPHTTRKPKPNEKDKQHFNFIKMEEFEQDVTQVIYNFIHRI